MRRKDREMSVQFALEVVDKCEYAILSLCLSDETPYSVPLTIVRENEFIYFHTALEGKKTDALKFNPKVCIACIGNTHTVQEKFTTEFESALIFGSAEEVTEREEKINALKLLCKRHTPLSMDDFDDAVKRSIHITGIWKVRIEDISGKRKKYDSSGVEMKFSRMS